MSLVSRQRPSRWQDPTDDRDFLICALDTLSGVLEALGPKTELLLGRSGLRDIILHCCQVGDCADPAVSACESGLLPL